MATYTQEDVTKALTCVAHRNGNVSQAIRDLTELKYVVPGRTTLNDWVKNVYVDEYTKIRENYKDQYEAEAVRGMRDVIGMAEEAERLAIQKAVAGLSNDSALSPDKAAQTALHLSRVKQSNVEKLLQLTGRPTEIIEDRSAEAALKALIARRIIKPRAPMNGDINE